LKIRLISEHPGRLAVRRKCELAGMARSTYYAVRNRPESQRARRNRSLLVLIRAIFGQYDERYGSRRIHADLRQQEVWCGRNRVARLMRQDKLSAIQPRKYRTTTDSRHDYPVAPDRLQRNFQAAGPNQVYVADISYIPTDEGWLYLASELDLYSHRIVGWSFSDRLGRRLALDALEMAAGTRRPGPGLIHHSDRGVQYACGDFQRLLAHYGMIPSMSRKGNPYDNAVAESFFRTLKVELVYRRRFRTRDEARSAIVKYIESFYNRRRRHSSLGYLSPAEFEQQACAA
jgi:putative transposase